MASFNIFAPGKKNKQRTHLLEFRAGKMSMHNDNWVYPDNRKGLLFIYKAADSLTHFCWKDRTSDKIEDDFIIFPNESVFSRINECKTGRVYLLKFKNSKKHFFWMQEPKEDRDVELCQLVNDILNSKKSQEDSEARSFNINEFTDLLGELHELGALNDLDIVEIFGGSQFSNEEGAAGTTNPFGANRLQPSNTEGTRENDTLRITKKLSRHTASTLDFKLDLKFSQHTLTKLYDNPLFVKHFITDLKANGADNASQLQPKQDNNQSIDNFELGVLDFLTTLGNEKTAIKSLKNIGLPTTLVKKNDKGELIDLIYVIDNYYLDIQNEQSKQNKDPTDKPE